MRVIGLFGPTGVGKTAVALALADRLRARGEDPVAISADALQVYRGLELVTGAPSVEERARLEHRLVGFVDPGETFSAGRFAELARHEIDAAAAAGRRPIVVGGTGLYLQAALAGLEFRPPPAPGVRERIRADLLERGPEGLHAELARRAPDTARSIDPADRTRVARALELLAAGEEPPPTGPDSSLWTSELRHPTLLCALVMDRDVLYRRIEERVDRMVAGGAAEEVRRIEAAGASATARKALGYEELLEGDVEGMKRRSRNLARRQLTWLRKLRDALTIDVTSLRPTEAAEEIVRAASSR